LAFSPGFNVLTGETGAGKSVLLGAIALLSGHRADPSVIRDKTKKCIIEAEILLNNKSLQVFFDQNDLDFEKETII
jgi:DNA repair protein RecN (Recombination protein N)